RLRVDFADSDTVIEQRLSMSIREVFEREGEAHFRDVEQSVIDEFTAKRSGVLATGGGVVLAEANRKSLHERSVVVYLKATPRDLLRRLRFDSKRPLLQVSDPLERLRQLYTERDPLYRSTAHFVVETGRPSVSMLVNLILMQLELVGAIDPERVPSPVDRPSLGP
ncbi:MAG: shikimate kinase, partial [Caldimonas sp.]